MSDIGAFPYDFSQRLQFYVGRHVIDDTFPVEDYRLDQTAGLISHATEEISIDSFIFPIFRMHPERIRTLELEEEVKVGSSAGGLFTVDRETFKGKVTVLACNDEKLRNFIGLNAFHRHFFEQRVKEMKGSLVFV